MKEPSLSEIEGGTPDSGIGMDAMDGKFHIYFMFRLYIYLGYWKNGMNFKLFYKISFYLYLFYVYSSWPTQPRPLLNEREVLTALTKLFAKKTVIADLERFTYVVKGKGYFFLGNIDRL